MRSSSSCNFYGSSDDSTKFKSRPTEVALPHHSYRWKEIQLIPTNIEDTKDLEEIIKGYNPAHSSNWDFKLLHHTVQQLSVQDKSDVFGKILPFIVDVAKKLPKHLRPCAIPLLRSGEDGSLTLQKKEIASLLANAFLCTFPERNYQGYGAPYSNYPSINFNGLFRQNYGVANDYNSQKLKCLFNYFDIMNQTDNCQSEKSVKFSRVYLKSPPKWANSSKTMKQIRVMEIGSKIEDSEGIQVDFANKKIGGGVIGKGCVQEEIRFITCPELIVARLFMEQMAGNEAIVVQGVEQYSNYEGYQDTFKYTGKCSDDPEKAQKRILVAIDALDMPQILKDEKTAVKYRTSLVNVLKNVLRDGYARGMVEHYTNKGLELGLYQYTPAAINRELMKAYAGFSCQGIGVPHGLPIASGNWGGGCFKGDPILKAKIQHLAASEAERDLHYHPFNDFQVKEKVEKSKLNGAYVASAYHELLDYAEQRMRQIVHQAHSSRF